VLSNKRGVHYTQKKTINKAEPHSHVPKKKEVIISYQNIFNYYRHCKLRNLKNIKFVQMLELVYNTKTLSIFQSFNKNTGG
jgi:hypothetical protein